MATAGLHYHSEEEHRSAESARRPPQYETVNGHHQPGDGEPHTPPQRYPRRSSVSQAYSSRSAIPASADYLDPHPDASPRLRSVARHSPAASTHSSSPSPSLYSTSVSSSNHRHSRDSSDELVDFALDDTDEQQAKYARTRRRRKSMADTFPWPTARELLSYRYWRAQSCSTQLVVSLLTVLLVLFLVSFLHRLYLYPAMISSLLSALSPSARVRPTTSSAAGSSRSLLTDSNDVLLHPSTIDSHIAHAPRIHQDHLDLAPHSTASLPVYTLYNLTLFTTFTPESASDHSEWQHAVFSWTRTLPQTQLLIFTARSEHCGLIHELSVDVRCRVSSCWDLVRDAPYLDCVLREAAERTTTPLLLFIEDHIVIFNDFIPALLKVANALPQFVASGGSRSMTLHSDAQLDLLAWHKDIEQAYLHDASALGVIDDTKGLGGERMKRKKKRVGKGLRKAKGKLTEPADEEDESLLDHAHDDAGGEGEHALHYFAYHRDRLPVEAIADGVLMGGSAYTGHEWEKLLISSLLLHNSLPLVDVTDSVMSVALTHSDHGNSTTDFNKLNSQLTANLSGLPLMNLGRLDNSHYVLTGKCPTCSLKENREADLPLILIRHANAARQIVVIAVNSEYLSLAFNWLCRAHALHINNYILLAEDRLAYRILRKMDIPVVLRRDAPYRKQAAVHGSKAFQETLYLRAIFFQQVVSLGFHLIFSHLDTIWYQNPLPYFDSSSCDMHVQFEAGGGRAGGGLLAIKSNSLGIQFVNDYLECEYENYAFITLHGRGRFTYSDDPDIDCIELISQRIERRVHMQRCPLPPLQFVSEVEFFDAQSPQHHSVWPYFIHLNQAATLRNKTQQFLDWDLWAVDDNAMTQVPLTLSSATAHTHFSLQCKRDDARVPAPSFDKAARIRMVVNVLASTEAYALEQTLLHLAEADYATGEGRVIVDVHISIQQPDSDTSTSNKKHVETTQTAQAFQWPHGEKKLLYLDSYVGPTDRWLDSWSVDVGEGTEDEEVFQLPIYAGMLVSKQWFVWLRRALLSYYFDPFQFDPQLLGIHLLHQFAIVGETPAARYGSRIPSSVLNGTLLYHYQFVPLMGTVFFPNHFLSFLHWYHGQQTSVPSNACVPTLLSNRWYLDDGRTHWQQWLQRFTFESGWYALYTNFHSSNVSADGSHKPRALVIDVTPASAHLTVSLIKRLGAREREFMDVRDIQLYDFHFVVFDRLRHELAYRKTMFPPVPIQLNSHNHQQEVKKREDDRQKLDAGEQSMPSDARDSERGSHTEEGLWARIERYKARVVDVGDMSLVHGHDEHSEQENAADDEQHAIDAMYDSESQQGVTATELIIELMVLAMSAEQDDETAQPQDIVEAAPYVGQMQLIRQQIDRSLTAAAHRHDSPRNPYNLSRCYTIDQLGEIETLTSQSTPSASLVAPTQYTIQPDILELYTSIYHKQTATLLRNEPSKPVDSAVRFIVYQPTKYVPFDRHLRGIYFCFLLAIITDRILLIDLPEFHLLYRSPFVGTNVTWVYGQYESAYMANRSLTRGVMETDVVNARLRTEDVNEVFSQHVLVHVDGVAHDRLLFKNKMYNHYLPSLFYSYSRMRRTGTLMRLMLSEPQPALLHQVAQTIAALQLAPMQYKVCVHLIPAVGTTIADSHWDCIISNLISLGWAADDIAILVSWGGPRQVHMDWKTEAERRLAKYGQVRVNEVALAEGRGGQCNATVNASQPAAAAGGGVDYDPYIINHFLLGECDVSISSGSTFGIFGAARSGFSKRAYVYKAAPPPVKAVDGTSKPSEEKDYCGPMHRVDMPKENDINF